MPEEVFNIKSFEGHWPLDIVTFVFTAMLQTQTKYRAIQITRGSILNAASPAQATVASAMLKTILQRRYSTSNALRAAKVYHLCMVHG
jgi:hypothetical protein